MDTLIETGRYSTGSVSDDSFRTRTDLEVTLDVGRPGTAEFNEYLGHFIKLLTVSDFAWLIENGDKDDDDVMVHILDGAKKRDKEPLSLTFENAVLETKVQEKKGTTEITLFLVACIVWEE